MSKKTLKIGGVPEHFNLPWRMGIEQGIFDTEDYTLTWQDFSGGTGAMTKALRAHEIDFALVLSEGIIADIIKGSPSKILKIYVQSPLTWGIYTRPSAPLDTVDQTATLKYGISRLGSGSHLMSFVNASQRGWDLDQMTFVPLKNLDGIRQGIKDKEADVFMWEQVMTKPYVASGELKKLGVCVTPWPCFMMAAHNDVLSQYPDAVRDILQKINHFCESFKDIENIHTLIVNRYGLDPQEVQRWLVETTWATDDQIDPKIIEKIVDTLLHVKVIPHKLTTDQLLAQ